MARAHLYLLHACFPVRLRVLIPTLSSSEISSVRMMMMISLSPSPWFRLKSKHKEHPGGALALPNAALAIFLANIWPASSVRMFEGFCILLALYVALYKNHSFYYFMLNTATGLWQVGSPPFFLARHLHAPERTVVDS
jgi:hypothetical protein